MRRASTGWLLIALLFGAAGGTDAQEPVEDQESPRVESVVFEGVEGLDEGVLRDSIATQETRCRGLLLRPFCSLTDAGLFVEKHYLDREELPLDEIRIRVIYFRRGYRYATVRSEIDPEGEGVRVTFSVDEGPLTRIDGLTVTRTDSILDEGQIEDAGLPGEGDALDLNALDSAGIRLRNMLWDLGHADAVAERSIEIDPATHTASVDVVIRPGSHTTIGRVDVEGNDHVSARTIRRLFGLEPGDPYRRKDMTRAQRRLYETELFRQALVRVPETEDSAKTVVISVREAPPRAISVGPGFNTVEFVQGEVRFTRYDWMGGARRLDVRGAVGNLLAPQLYGRSFFGSSVPDGIGEEVDGAYLDPTWFVGADMTQPFFLSTRNSLGVGVSAHRRSIPGIVIDKGMGARASFTHQAAEGLPVSLEYRFEATRVEAGDIYFCVSFGVCDPLTIAALAEPHRMSPARLSARMERTDDPLAPTTGYQARLEVEHASSLTLSDFQHQRVVGEVSRYLGFGGGVLAGRARAGWVRALDGAVEIFGIPGGSLTILHPRRRFLAGGARSVRGYGENQLGPRVLTIPSDRLRHPTGPDGSGDGSGGDAASCTVASIRDRSCDPNVAPSSDFQPRPLGGHTLLEGSVEYRRPLTGTLTAAAFVDAGLLRGQRLNFPPGSRSAVTPGAGIRYQSPIGPVRVDLGFRTSGAEELPVVTEVQDADGTRHLVQLETMKRYDPFGESRSFLGGLLSRLQLHLAIGEAF